MLFDIVVDLEQPLSFGRGPQGRRILFGAAGGSFVGPRMRGTVSPGGGDWTTFDDDGTMRLDVRLALVTDDGARILATYHGVRAGDYFRTVVRFETGAEPYAWLNEVVALGSGYLVDDGVAYRVEHVL
ncbi:UNVERIFIED_CONTAM: hypothetical protein LK11_08560 [Mumia flava]